MNSPEKNIREIDRYDRSLSHQLRHWVDEYPSPEAGRQSLLQEASEEKNCSSEPHT